jgi:hypothetical protein
MVATQPLHGQQLTAEERREMALALTAGPPHVAAAAEVRVLRNGRYEMARPGSNGFTCMVEHEDPATVEPVCYDAEGTAAFLPVANAREAWRLARVSEEEIRERIQAGFAEGRFHAPRRAGLAYMLSPEQTVRDESSGEIIPFVPHLMFYAPGRTAVELGLESPEVAAPAGRPFLVFEADPRGLVIVPVAGQVH